MPWNPLEPALLADVNIAELLRSDLKVLYAEIRLVVMRLMELYQVSVSAPPLVGRVRDAVMESSASDRGLRDLWLPMRRCRLSRRISWRRCDAGFTQPKGAGSSPSGPRCVAGEGVR